MEGNVILVKLHAYISGTTGIYVPKRFSPGTAKVSKIREREIRDQRSDGEKLNSFSSRSHRSLIIEALTCDGSPFALPKIHRMLSSNTGTRLSS